MAIGKHDRLDILGVDLMLTRTGDGLSEAMQVDPVKLRHGERIFLIGTAVIVDERYPFANKQRDALRLKYVAQAEELHIVDEADIGDLLEKRHRAVQDGIASMKGQESLDVESELD